MGVGGQEVNYIYAGVKGCQVKRAGFYRKGQSPGKGSAITPSRNFQYVVKSAICGNSIQKQGVMDTNVWKGEKAERRETKERYGAEENRWGHLA